MKTKNQSAFYRLLLILLAAFPAPLVADPTPAVRFELAPSRPGYLPYDGLASHRGGNFDFQTVTRFSFDAGESIHEFHWRGAFQPADRMTPPPDLSDVGDWEITIWSDENGRPGEVIAAETVPAAAVAQTEFGTEHYWYGAVNFIDYAFTFTTPFAAQARTQYWISTVYLSDASFPLFIVDSGVTGEIPVEQLAWASARQPLENSLILARHEDQNNPPVFSDRIWELQATQASMKLLTLPQNDADNDGMDDDWETAHQLNTTIDDSAADLDEDGSDNLEEYIRGTNPRISDTDSDGLPDGVESNSGIYLGPTDTGTSPLLADSDRDGLGDAIEIPTEESDGPDQPGTDPNQKDTDGDGYADGFEIAQSFSPVDDAIHPTPVVLPNLVGNDLTESPGATFDHREASSTQPAHRQGTFMDLFDNTATGSTSFWRTRANFRVDVTLGGTPHVLDSFTLTSGISGDRDNDPMAWELQGSNDGVIFETIFHRDNPQESVWTAASQTVRFDAGVHYPAPAAYTTFRLQLYLYQDQPEVDIVELGELELIGTKAVITVTNTNDSGLGSLRQAIADSAENGTVLFDGQLSGETINLEEGITLDRSLKVDASALDHRVTLQFPFLGIGWGTAITINEEVDAELASLKISGSGSGALGLWNFGHLRIDQGSISGFSHTFAGGVINDGELEINHSAIFDNFGLGAGGLLNHGEATLRHCTITKNHAPSFLAVPNTRPGGGGIANHGYLTLDHVTLTENRGDYAGGLSLETGGSSTISNSIIADNTQGARYARRVPDLVVEPTASSARWFGVNLFSDLTGTGLTEGPGIIVADPRLAPLGDYGGPTMTMPPMPDSPAIDAAPSSVSTTDQRGFPIVNLPDLGSTEYQGTPDFARVFPVDNDNDGTPFGIEQAIGSDPFTPDPAHPGHLTLPTLTPDGAAALTFALSPDAHPDTVWIVERTTDLLTFTEILRHDGAAAVHGDTVTSFLEDEFLTVTDRNPPAGHAYYRFRAILNPTN